MSALLSTCEAATVVAACKGVTAGAESTERELRQELEERTAIRDVAKTAVRSAEHRFDVEESEEAALALATARRNLEGAELLVGKSRERLERAEASTRTAREALARAESELRVAELRARLDAPPAALDALDVARLEIKQAHIEARRIVGAAEERFAGELAPLFARLDEDARVREELEILEVHVAPVSPLHLLHPWLRVQLDEGALHVDTRPTWSVTGGVKIYGTQKHASPVEVDGSGALSVAYASLLPLARAVAKRNVVAVLEQLEDLARPGPESPSIAAELLELLAECRDDASLRAAIAEREGPEKERLRNKRELHAQQELQAPPPKMPEDQRAWIESQARAGVAYAKRLLGIEGQALIEGAPLPRPGAPVPTLFQRQGAHARGLLPEPEANEEGESDKGSIPMLRLRPRIDQGV